MKKEDTAYKMNIKPVAKKEAMVCGKDYRFTILTERLIRMEYQKDGLFNDEPTQIVICRDFKVPDYEVVDAPDRLEIITKGFHLYYNKKSFSAEGLFIGLKERYTLGDSVWNYGDEIVDLRGTARTLDEADGAIELDAGLMSRAGYTVLDDAKSALLTEDGWAKPREEEAIDLYFFGYGHDYSQCLKDFYYLSGATPLLPKYTLGNWWSRYYRYTEESYLQLMEKFHEKDIPISVSVIDMDWHLTDVPKEYGSGWTGYTWNRELFPEPERFLKKLHEKGKRITLNLHPADGVRAFEEAYLPMARELGVDYDNEEKIPFDVTDRKYMEAYFKYLHHPNEEIGVDFWWVDWQQGSQSRTKGIDPLWMLNHLHFMDSGREGKLPLTFSRYAGLGSHRYPVGFSGDSVTSWKSLEFQPYFTANATNAGYTWWSHDIGGHQRGRRDDELVVRWIQYGVFSPIMRVHSTSNEFYGKEPWNYNMEAEKIITSFMQLRHKLVPYLHTWNYKTHFDGEPLIQPMYYRNDMEEAYQFPNQYYFGDMIVCPITRPADKETLMAEVDAWIPEGIYYDLFTGQVYQGTQRMLLYRNLETIPVLVPAGAIIPLAGDYEHCCQENPKELDVLVFNGKDGCFEMYEDDCSEMNDMQPVITRFSFTTGEKAKISMNILEDVQGVIPADRSYVLRIRGMQQIEDADVNVQDAQSDGDIKMETDFDTETMEMIVRLTGTNIKQFTIVLKNDGNIGSFPDEIKSIYNILLHAQMEYETKAEVFRVITEGNNFSQIVMRLTEMKLNENLFGTILEHLSTYY